MELTPEALSKAEFRGPVRFYDGYGGMAMQEWECKSEPRLGYAWRRENTADRGRQFYLVDGKEVKDLCEAATLLAGPADPDSPRERERRSIEEFHFSPSVPGATRALSEARCNGDAGPFGTVRAWMNRADNSWHQGINKLSEKARTEEAPWPRWLYSVKSAAHETYRGMYLFEADRKKDDDLRCALGTRCRDCPILQQVEASMVEATKRDRWPAEVDQADIDAAKVWTCIGHVLTEKTDLIDGAIFDVASQRDQFG